MCVRLTMDGLSAVRLVVFCPCLPTTHCDTEHVNVKDGACASMSSLASVPDVFSRHWWIEVDLAASDI